MAAEGRGESVARTDRPGAVDGHETLPTVREVIGLDAVAQGGPEVLVGDDALEARVRWVHVSDSAGVARLLNGGELLLSTGSAWPDEPAELRRFVDGLVDAGLAGLILELGSHYRSVPAVVVDAARERGLALVALHREVKFVSLTEAVHGRIISAQTEALRARDEVRERFTALSLRGAPADFIVHQLAQTLGAPVILENLAHEVVASEVPPALEEELFTGWELRSRAAHRTATPGGVPRREDWLIVPVEARGIRWGSLIALPGPAASGRSRRRARAGRDRARDRPARRRRSRRVGAHRTSTTARRPARRPVRGARGCRRPRRGRRAAAAAARGCTAWSSRARR